MITKVKGEAIKEGSIPLSALSNEVKNKIAKPDWGASIIDNGYIANKTHDAYFASIYYDKENNKGEYEVYNFGDKLLLRYNEKYFTVYKNIPLTIDVYDGEDTFVVDYNGSTLFITDNNGMLQSEYRRISVSETIIPLEEAFIPDTIIKTIPQTLSETDKNQALANLGINEKIDKLANITYLNLKSLRDNSQLIPGQQYRITDFVTTTAQENTRSAEHQFDVIVTADNENTLNEVARACLHEGDTYFSEAGANLAAWKIWYCLENDTERFAWADTQNGKGVIYRMIDEWNNDCPYDFKNIKSKHPKDTKIYPDYYYAFTVILSGLVNDFSLEGADCYGNTMGWYGSEKRLVNRNVFINTTMHPCHSNTFRNNCHDNAFGDNCNSNSFGNNCYSNSFGNYCNSNSFGDNCNSNSFGDNCNSNSFGDNCNSNRSRNLFSYNSFGNGCYKNIFPHECKKNSFSNSCYSNDFGDNCQNNSFGNNCYKNSFGDGCNSNTFGNSCYSNTFGNSCLNNSFSNSCYSNDFGDNCQNNSFSDNCFINRFGNGSYGNNFKNNCHDNSFGIGCGYNSFGNSCKFNIFGESTDNIKSYYRYIIFDDGNSYINLNCTSTTSSSNYYQNVRIGLGVNNNKSTYKTITDSNVGQTYETLYKPTNSKELTA